MSKNLKLAYEIAASLLLADVASGTIDELCRNSHYPPSKAQQIKAGIEAAAEMLACHQPGQGEQESGESRAYVLYGNTADPTKDVVLGYVRTDDWGSAHRQLDDIFPGRDAYLLPWQSAREEDRELAKKSGKIEINSNS